MQQHVRTFRRPMVLLIHPPVTKPSEPSAGIAKLAYALHLNHIPHVVIDANIEGLLFLLQHDKPSADTWSQRAQKYLPQHLASLKNGQAFEHPDRYHRAVADINRLVTGASDAPDIQVSLQDYNDQQLKPIRSQDLIRSAENFTRNPFYPYFKTRLRSLLAQSMPQIVGFSVNYLHQALCAFAMIGFLKREAPHLRIVIGGGLVTSWHAAPNFKNPFQGLVDDLIAGPGEAWLLAELGVQDPVQGYLPDYRQFPIASYLAPGFVFPYAASLGCYWRKCAFCPENAEQRRYHPVPADRLEADLAAAVQGFNPSLMHFMDHAVSPAQMKTLIRIGPTIPWYGFTRVTSNLTNPDFCRGLKQSGCIMLKLGIESGSQDVLDNMQKGLTLDTISNTLKTLKKAGIATYVYLLFGTPWENRAFAEDTLKFVLTHAAYIDFLNLAIFNLPRHLNTHLTLDTHDFYGGDLSLYLSFAHPMGWDRSIVRRFLEKEFKKKPPIAKIVKRNPLIFTSNHAPFFLDQQNRR